MEKSRRLYRRRKVKRTKRRGGDTYNNNHSRDHSRESSQRQSSHRHSDPEVNARSDKMKNELIDKLTENIMWNSLTELNESHREEQRRCNDILRKDAEAMSNMKQIFQSDEFKDELKNGIDKIIRNYVARFKKVQENTGL